MTSLFSDVLALFTINLTAIYADPCKNAKSIVNRAKEDIHYSKTNKTSFIYFNKDGRGHSNHRSSEEKHL